METCLQGAGRPRPTITLILTLTLTLTLTLMEAFLRVAGTECDRIAALHRRFSEEFASVARCQP